MASLISFCSVISTNIVILILLCSFYKNGHALERRLAEGSNFHSVLTSSIAPATACRPSSSPGAGAGTGKAASLKVVNRHGPCHVQPNKEADPRKPNFTEILRADESRARAIQARHAAHANSLLNSDAAAAPLPANSGASFDAGDYVVAIGLGSPKNDFAVIFDTGSDLTWTQCEPCAGSCFKQKGPVYDPANSTTYSNVSCSSSQCSEINSATGNPPGCSASSACTYSIAYGDGSFSTGLFGEEKLTLTPTDEFDGFLFGCGQNNQGIFGEVAGLMGLGRNPVSIVSQTAQKYGKFFSYCLPTMSGSNGHLTFGNGSVPGEVQFTPFSSSQPDVFYFIDLEGISIGGKILDISVSIFQSAGTIIDSGTVITRLPASAYTALRDAFLQEMAQFKRAPPFSILDTCFDFGNQTTVEVPKLGFRFAGNLTVDFSVDGTLVSVSETQVCLAFAGNSDDADLGIFGNIQQQTLEVVYDVAGGKLGFGADGCS